MMRTFCPAIVLSSSLLVVPPSQTWPGGPHPLLCSSERPAPTPEVGRVAPSETTRDLRDRVGVAPDSPVLLAVELEGLLVRCGHRPDHAFRRACSVVK